MTPILKTLTNSSFLKVRERHLQSPKRSIEIQRVTLKMILTRSSCHKVLEESPKSQSTETTILTCTMEKMRWILMQMKKNTIGRTLQHLLDIVNFHQWNHCPKDLYRWDISTTSTPSLLRHTTGWMMNSSTISSDSQKAIARYQRCLITARMWPQTQSSPCLSIHMTTHRTIIRAIRQMWYQWWTNR